ncbi:alkylhydroperoxidase family enzyme [Chitinophaga dinghuensis]|uniref:Alkylhydroperoxidase family enzyme n=1 Tax=Chitinophaga dinghuensis TaxID=1539050 RepID=A0A327VNC4_9BACT|nr:carboxymuconolactone decarboxylase family protein [Chitinophaga dinghuensis]RAJ76593.1 alkylhydroperoxidase family enzyme [Chitinophaga dinghuensis]
MRLAPITTPHSWLLKAAYFASKRTFGKVLGALQIIYARHTPIFRVMLRILKTEKRLSLDENTKILIHNFVSHLNDCPFCSNTSAYMASKSQFDRQKMQDLLNYSDSATFSLKEKALMEYLESVTYTKNASDDCFQRLKLYFNEREIVEITWLCAVENYFNMQAKPLGIPSDELKAYV